MTRIKDMDHFEMYEQEYYYGYYDENNMSEEDLIKLDEGTTFVYDTLGRDIALTKKEIRKTLWNSYFNYDKTIAWVLDELSKKADKEEKEESTKKKKKKKNIKTEEKKEVTDKEAYLYTDIDPIMKAMKSIQLEDQDSDVEYISNGNPIINLFVIGHAQSGRSTLMGHLLHDLDQIPKEIYDDLDKKKEKNKETGFNYASVVKRMSNTETDESSSVDHGCWFQTYRYQVYFTDEFDYSDFSKSVKLVSEADTALIVLDASSKDDSDEGYTIPLDVKLGVALTQVFGIQKLIFTINKLDSIEWSSSRYNEIKGVLEKHLAHFKLGKNDLSIIPVSGLTGGNLIDGSEIPALMTWYNGPSLIEQINKLTFIDNLKNMPLRIYCSYLGLDTPNEGPIQIHGVVQSGKVSVGDKVIVVPGNKRGIIKEMVGYNGSEEAYSRGYRIFTIENLKKSDFTIGCVLCKEPEPVQCVRYFEADIIFTCKECSFDAGSYVNLQLGNARYEAFINEVLYAKHFTTDHTNTNGSLAINYGMTGKIRAQFLGNPIPLEISRNRRIQKSVTFSKYYSPNCATGFITKVTPVEEEEKK